MTLYEKIQAERAKYPADARSAVLPALRLAQEEHGWLPPEVIREVAEALELTPAYCESIATFYDQFHTKPIGKHIVEVCTNVSCAVVGAQKVLEAFEDGVGCHAGETSSDGEFTLRAVECLGGCGWATIVAIDDHYRTHVKPEDVPAIVEELKNGAA